MRIVKIEIPTAKRVQAFVDVLLGLEGDFELLSGPYIIDARSLMGIFSLDLSKPIDLKVYVDTEKNLAAITPFLAKEER